MRVKSGIFRHDFFEHSIPLIHGREVPTINTITVSGIALPDNQTRHSNRCPNIKVLAILRPRQKLAARKRLRLRNLWIDQRQQRQARYSGFRYRYEHK